MEKENNEVKETEKKPLPLNVIPKKPVKNDDFKRKYFDYYDDVKISDRQDW